MEALQDIEMEEETQEVTFADMLLEEQDNVDVDVDDEELDDDDEAQDGETPEELKERLRKRNHSLRKSKQAQKRTLEENAELKERLIRIEEKMNQRQPETSNSREEAERREQKLQELKDSVADDPSTVVDLMSDLETRVASYLGDELKQIKEMISGVKTESNPELFQNRKEIDAIKAKFQDVDLNDYQALKMLNALKAKKAKVPAGSIFGGKAARSSVPQKKKEVTLTAEEIAMMGFDD